MPKSCFSVDTEIYWEIVSRSLTLITETLLIIDLLLYFKAYDYDICFYIIWFIIKKQNVFFISDIRTWRLSSSMSTWFSITARSSTRTTPTSAEQDTTWGSSSRSDGPNFWSKLTNPALTLLHSSRQPWNSISFVRQSTRTAGPGFTTQKKKKSFGFRWGKVGQVRDQRGASPSVGFASTGI